MKILMVCLGNICRSPLAEGILQKKAQDNTLPWHIDSAGTGAWHIGEKPDGRSIKKAHEYGINITNQRARQFKVKDFDNFDLIFVMDSSNYQNVCKLARHQVDKDKVKLIMNQVKPNYNQAVPDPYWDDNGFENVYQMLDAACEKIIENFS